MGGSINIWSSETGTRFTLIIPSVLNDDIDDDDSTSENHFHFNVDMKSNAGSILLIEDNTLNQRSITTILKRLGYTVIIANDGLEALKIFKESDVDLILMDCQMPNMNGFQTTIEIRQLEKGTSKHMPIIGITAHALESHRQKCLESGMDDYISKPINIYDLNKLINKYKKIPQNIATNKDPD
jgi:CheY-like chemotaxis protein